MRFLDALAGRKLELHSVMVVIHGSVVAEGWWRPYERHHVHETFSASKSVTSTAIALAQAEGLLSVDDRVLLHFPELSPPNPDLNLASMRIRHLLSMTTGHGNGMSDDVFGGQEWTRTFLSLPVENEPGTRFVYDTSASYMLSAIIQKVTGQRMIDYLGPRLFEPLGVTGATWDRSPEGVDTGGFGLSITTEDLACFGQLYLDDGVWKGKRLLPDGWAAEATRAHTPTTNEQIDWAQGYGYQFWRGRHKTYRADGAFGQYSLVLPEQDAVVAITAGVSDTQGIVSTVWDYLLAGMGKTGSEPVPVEPDPNTQTTLAVRLSDLRIEAPTVHEVAPAVQVWAGRRIAFDANRFGIASAVIDPSGGRTRITTNGDAGPMVLDAGHGSWEPGQVAVPRGAAYPDNPVQLASVVAAAAWPGEDTMRIIIRLIESSFVLTLTAVFSGETINVSVDLNAWFRSPHLADLTGHLVNPHDIAAPRA